MSLSDAIDDYQHGRLHAAYEQLAGAETTSAQLLFVRVHTRFHDTRKAKNAISLARALTQSSEIDSRDRVQAGVLLAFLLARAGDVEGGARAIGEAKTLLELDPTAPASLESEMWHGDATIRYAQGALAESERSAWNAVYADLELTYRPASLMPAVVPIQVTKARALQLIGLIRGTQERYHEQYRFLREAMTTLRSGPSPDLYLASFLQANRSFYARDFGILSEIIELEMVPHESWPGDLAELRIEITRSLAYLYALNGNDELAMHGFAAAAGYTKSKANRLLLISDEAFVSRHLPSPRILRAKLTEACTIADAVDWETSDSERYALHAFAQELAFVTPTRAMTYMSRFTELKSAANPLWVSDKRVDAEAYYSAGLVYLANNQRDQAVHALVAAFEIWRDVGFRWRATAVAIELAELTSSAGFASYTGREVAQYPNSWLARRAMTLGEQAS